MNISFTLSPSAQDIETIYAGLGEFNRKFTPEIDDEAFGLLVRDHSGNVLGGLTGFIYVTTLQIRFLWLSEDLRAKGIGSELMNLAELECKKRNIPNIAVDTYTFQAPKFYESHGFQEIGRYRDYQVKGVDKIFYHKSLG